MFHRQMAVYYSEDCCSSVCKMYSYQLYVNDDEPLQNSSE